MTYEVPFQVLAHRISIGELTHFFSMGNVSRVSLRTPLIGAVFFSKIDEHTKHCLLAQWQYLLVPRRLIDDWTARNTAARIWSQHIERDEKQKHPITCKAFEFHVARGLSPCLRHQVVCAGVSSLGREDSRTLATSDSLRLYP